MAKQYHFVCYYDTDTKEFYVDSEGYPDGCSLWDTDTDEWVRPDPVIDYEIYTHLVSVLGDEGAVEMETIKEREQ